MAESSSVMSKPAQPETQKKRKSRDAARSRRGQQNDEFGELANQLPLPAKVSNQLDRLCIMRLANSFIKIKQLIQTIIREGPPELKEEQLDSGPQNLSLLETAMDGFVFVVSSDGQCLYVSDNMAFYLGLSQVEVTGNSFYKYIHPCDHEELSKQLGGRIPLEDMEIFDGLFCSDSVFAMSNYLGAGAPAKKHKDSNPYRSFFVRMKSTLTSRGKSVNLKASTYRVVHVSGCIKTTSKLRQKNSNSYEEEEPSWLIGVGVPLMFAPSFEVPLDSRTYISRHSMDFKFVFCENSVSSLLGYRSDEMIGRSLYKFSHACDTEVMLDCHKTLLTKGQSISRYYRFLAKKGGWVWMQTKANVVYASKSCQPQFILCLNYVISGVEFDENVLAREQQEEYLLSSALADLTEESSSLSRRKRRTKLCSSNSKTKVKLSESGNKPVVIKTEPGENSCNYSAGCEGSGCNTPDKITHCQDTIDDLYNHEMQYEGYLHEHYSSSIINHSNTEYTKISPEKESSTSDKKEDSKIESGSNKEHKSTDLEKKAQRIHRPFLDEDEFECRAPRIPLVDAQLLCDETMMYPFTVARAEAVAGNDSNDSPPWLESGPFSDKSDSSTSSPAHSENTFHKKLEMPGKVMFTPRSNALLQPSDESDKSVSVLDLLFERSVPFPYVTTYDAEVNAPVNAPRLLHGEDLLQALDQSLAFNA